MAKLSARGRTELVRISKEGEVTRPDAQTDWERVTFALMSDHTVLRKWDVRFKPSTFQPEGSKHSYGWKKFGKLKAEVTVEAFVGRWTAKGYTVVS